MKKYSKLAVIRHFLFKIVFWIYFQIYFPIKEKLVKCDVNNNIFCTNNYYYSVSKKQPCYTINK